MGDDLRLADREYRDFAHRQSLAELQQPRLADEVGGAGFAQEINIEMGGDRKLDRADLRENGDVEPDIGEREKGRAGNRAAGPQLIRAIVKPQPRGHWTDGLDAKISSYPDLREFLRQIGGNFLRAEGGRRGDRIHLAIPGGEATAIA